MDALIVTIIVIAVLVVLALAALLAVKLRVASLKRLPNPIPATALHDGLIGAEVFVTTTDGTRLRTVSAGQGATVVLAHGYGYAAEEWNVIAARLLNAGYHVITFDQRGHGKSTIGSGGVGSAQMADDYVAVLEHYHVEDAILVGHSMGGFLAQVFWLRHPDVATARVSALVLFATFAGNVLVGAPQNRVQIPLIKYGILQRILKTDLGWLFGASLMGRPPSPAVIELFLKVFGAQDHKRLVPIIESFGREDYYASIHAIDVPTVVICGERDATTPRWHSEKLGTLIPKARNVWVPDKGHLLNWEAPDALIDAVTSLSGRATAN
jgi:pimeloyl-ACP methyl ester carboxylesterase